MLRLAGRDTTPDDGAVTASARASGAADGEMERSRHVGAYPAVGYAHSAIYDPVRDRMLVFGAAAFRHLQRRLGAVAGGHAGLDAADSHRHAAERAAGPQRDLRPGARPHGGLRGTTTERLRVLPQRRLGAVAGGHAGLDAADARRHAAERAAGHSAIYDPVRDRMVVFGGSAVRASNFNDVWALSLAGTPAWTQLTPIGHAAERAAVPQRDLRPGARPHGGLRGRTTTVRAQRRLGAVAGGTRRPGRS